MKVNVLNCEKIKNRYQVTINPHVFYIDGKGGQLGDRGKIGQADVIEVNENYVFTNQNLEPGEYSYSIDMTRREDIAQQHTAQHTFSAVAFNDYDFNTVGFRMADEYTTVDLDSNTITNETIEQIEKKVNDIINQGIDIKIYTVNHDEAFSIEGLRKPIKEKITGDVRFVEIPHIDIGACAGFHVNNTREMRLFKIINHEKIKGNFTRFYFLAGNRALNDYSYKHMLTRELCHTFSCTENNILDMVDKMNSSKLEAENSLKHLAIEYSSLLAKDVINNALSIKNYKLVIYNGNKLVGDNLHKLIADDNFVVVTSNELNHAISSKSINCKELIGYISQKKEIKGGGNQIRGNFKGNITSEEVEKYIIEYINTL